MDREQLFAAFQFVTNRGFVQAEPEVIGGLNSLRLSYDGPEVRIDLSHDDRDGFDCRLVFSSDPDACVNVGTLMGALKRDETTTARSDRDHLEEQVRFVREHLDKLLALPSQVLDDCRALRFFHVAHWRERWGQGIQMDPDEMHAEARRLERLRDYFVGR